MELLNQPLGGQLGDRIIEMLDSKKYKVLNIIVAFAKNSGVLRLKSALERFRKSGGQVNVYVGVDLDGTSYEALTALLFLTDNLVVVHAENGQTFHSKIYQFIGKDERLIVVGSHNLTGGGLWTNFESSVVVPHDNSSSKELDLSHQVGDFISQLSALGQSFRILKTQRDVDELLDSGYVSKEVAVLVRRVKATKTTKGRAKLFGRGVAARLPRLTPVAPAVLDPVPVVPAMTGNKSKQIVFPHNESGPTIWFETRKMTGGSRNILDLSKKSLVDFGDPRGTDFEREDSPKFMKGAVEFFGIDPEDELETRSVTVNFEGVDYMNNKILFPVGEKANGSWRIQFNGYDISGREFTLAINAARRGKELNANGKYLPNKIVTLTKVQDDYYFMSVFPESEIPEFKTASGLIARNGVTKRARLYGCL